MLSARHRENTENITGFIPISCVIKSIRCKRKRKAKLAGHREVVTKDSLTIPVTAKKSVNNALQHVKTVHCSASMLGFIVIFISHVVGCSRRVSKRFLLMLEVSLDNDVAPSCVIVSTKLHP